ncbi:MAG: hypothetical protein WCS15_09405, partial [Prevotella sp.]
HITPEPQAISIEVAQNTNISAMYEPMTVNQMYYGYIPTEITGATEKVEDITFAMITAAIAGGTIVSATAGTLDKTSIGIVPAGAFVAVFLPSDANLIATKFDGISSKVAFSENNGASGTGCNGADIALDSISYDAYGEFKLTQAELFIYIHEVA